MADIQDPEQTGTSFAKFIIHFRLMTKKLENLTTDQLRSLFLTQSKLFIKALDYSEEVDVQSRSLLLEELREMLRRILVLIKERESSEAKNLNI